MNNYTVTTENIDVAVGTLVYLTQPTITLTITPNTGYTVTSTDFSIGDPLPTAFSGVAINQNGSNVDVVLTFDITYIMPSSNIDLAIDIDGTAQEIEHSVAGTFLVTLDGITETTIAMSASGVYGSKTTLVNYDLTLPPGDYFPDVPKLVYTVALGAGMLVIVTPTLDINDNVIAYNYRVNYTFPNESITNQDVTVTAVSDTIYIPTEYIKSYVIDTSNVDLNGAVRTMKIYGDVGATFSLTINDGTSTTNIETNEVIPAIGYFETVVTIPAATPPLTYTLTLTGDLDPSFVQSNPFTIEQVAQTEVTFTPQSDELTYTVEPVAVSKSFTPNTTCPIGNASRNFFITWQWTSASLLYVGRRPNISDFTNTDSSTNGGTIMSFNDFQANGNGTNTITVQIDVDVTYYGSTDVNSVFDVSDVITEVNPGLRSTLVSVTSETTSAAACLLTRGTTAYHNGDNTDPISGDTLYSDPAGTTPYVGNGTDTYWNTALGAALVGADGVIDIIAICTP